MAVIGIAQYLAEKGLVTMTGPNRDVDFGAMPDGAGVPDEMVVLTPYGGPSADPKLGYDTPTFQVRVRGPRTGDAITPYNKAKAIYDVLHGLTNVELPDGTWVVSLIGLQSHPVWLERDENRRVHFVQNYQLEVRSVTEHRE